VNVYVFSAMKFFPSILRPVSTLMNPIRCPLETVEFVILLPITFRCDIPVVFYKLNTKYITTVKTQQKIIIVLCFTICFTTTCLGTLL